MLPRQQLLGQWRECCAIAKSIAEKGTPNHVLVNRIMEYPISHFWCYGYLIYIEMLWRRYSPDCMRFEKWFNTLDFNVPTKDELFSNWHNDRYLHQCLANLQEKYDCGAIPEEEWELITDKYPEWR